MDEAVLALSSLTPDWVEFLAMAGGLLLVGIGMLIWVFYLRGSGHKHRRRRRHHHERRSPNPTLAQTGGLPPARPSEPAEKPPPPAP
jgi:hypothetical protein